LRRGAQLVDGGLHLAIDLATQASGQRFERLVNLVVKCHA